MPRFIERYFSRRVLDTGVKWTMEIIIWFLIYIDRNPKNYKDKIEENINEDQYLWVLIYIYIYYININA